MKKCPICGRYMNSKIKCGYANSVFVTWECSCGFSAETDRAGLTRQNVIDRYQLMVSEDKKYEKIR